MKRFTFISTVMLVGTCAAFAPPAVAQHEHSAGDPGKLGKVSFPVSCDPSVQPQFSSAVAMLHSFWYEKAGETFADVAEKDPNCGMAHWGIAMTYYHQIWSPPGPADLKAGGSALEKANAGAQTQRERDYIAALATFFSKKHPARSIVVVIPELVEDRWYEYFLHNQRGRLLEWVLLARGNERIFTVSAPWYVGQRT